MKSNFSFLEKDMDSALLYNTAKKIEELYSLGYYDNVISESRKIIEQVVKMIADFEFLDLESYMTLNECLNELKHKQLIPKNILDLLYDIKNAGNKAIHNINEYSRNTGLDILKNLYEVLAWFSNTYMEQKVSLSDFFEPQPRPTYQPFERKLIYVQTVDNKCGEWDAYAGAEKIGDATIDDPESDNRPNSEDLKKAADKRVKQYMTTAGIPYKIEWAELAYRKKDRTYFRDYDVHEVLKRSGVKKSKKLAGKEWFLADLDTAKAAIKAVKDGKLSLDTNGSGDSFSEIVLRPEQQQAVLDTKKAFKKHDRMLWNAKMRFGKTITALQLVKEEKFKKVLILTHRPVVKDSWFTDFNKIGLSKVGYVYGSKTYGCSIEELVNITKPFVYFASLQDLRGSKIFGGKVGDKNRELVEIDWDLVIIDEAHEGTQTELAKNVIEGVKKVSTKLLELSGTPFNLLDKYAEDQIYTWDYVMEQEAKYNWEKEHPLEANPYDRLPKVSMYTFDISNKFKQERYTDLVEKSFNFREFFKVNDEGEFIHKDDVNRFLDNITNFDEKNSYPFSTPEFRARLRHTLWILPGIKEATALEKLMKEHAVFKEYRIVNVVSDGHEESKTAEKKAEDLEMVRRVITKEPSKTKTITLTVRKLTTGVTVKEWTGVIFLSNTNSAMQYLQAAFRAQTPFTDEKLGQKTNCYIFDFAPDRALTVMAEASKLNTGVGKLTSSVQKNQMDKLLNFMPIIGEVGNGMKRFGVDTLLTKIKRVYAEKAVKTGFDDDSLYSDELLKLSETDINEFNGLKAIVGSTPKEKRKTKIDVNNQGLSDEEYERATNAEKKKKKERTEEEQVALEKMRVLRKQRKTMISILRSISIRIPMMIYGMDIKIDDDVTIRKFVNLVDDVSWDEFMPKGVTKELFLQFSKYYDQDVFIEAGRIIRRKVKKLDELDPIERAVKLADIFGTFRNPDKETVLTPWRVVNLQLGKTLGGYSFYDTEYKNTTVDGKDAAHWIDTEYTRIAFNDNTHILEINSKTGLYPLYATISMFYQEQQKLNELTAGKFSEEDELFIWQKILRENIFVIAKTPMAKYITQRTLAGYQNFDTNIVYVEDIVEKLKKNKQKVIQEIRKAFNGMKFDVVIGNPPYQEVVAKKDTNNGQKRVNNIFQNFQELSDMLAEKYSVLIYPGGRWIHRSGKGMNNFGYNQINDPHLAKLVYYPNANELFPDVGIADGLSIVFKNMDKKTKGFRYIYSKNNEEYDKWIGHLGHRLLTLNPKDGEIADLIDKFVIDKSLKYISESDTINQKLFKIESNFAEKNPSKLHLMLENEDIDYSKSIKLLTNDRSGKSGRAHWFVADRDVITTRTELIDKWKVIVSSANAGGQKRDNQIEVIDNHSAFGRSRIALKAFDTKREAENFFKYATSVFVKFAFLLTDESLTTLGKAVPDLLDYTDNNKFLDFSEDIDIQMRSLVGITSEQLEYMTKRVSNIQR